MPRKGSGETVSKSMEVKIDFDNLYEYKHLSYAWFVRYALLLAAGLSSDPFEGPINPNDVKGALNIINRKIEDLSQSQRGKKSSDNEWDACSSNLTSNDEIKLNDFNEETKKIGKKCFMDFEFREFIRVFGGMGHEVRNIVKPSRAIAKLAKLGRALTSVGGSFLFLDIDFALQRDIYDPLRDFVSFANNEEVSYLAKLVGSSAVIVYILRRNRLDSQLEKLLEHGVVMYEVFDDKVSMMDLTNIIRHIDSLRLSQHIYELFNISRSLESPKKSKSRRKSKSSSYSTFLDLLNKVSESVMEYVNSRRLLPIYEYVRYAITTLEKELEKEEIRKKFGQQINKILNTLYEMGDFRYYEG